jgi:simple sugar transport system ATP-binding protein
MQPARLALSHISKRYPGVVANDDVSLTVQPGEIHAVLGENGAGKSTLMKIIFGMVKPDSGMVQFNGQPITIQNPKQAKQLGIAMVFQHFSLFDSFTVAENVWFGLDNTLNLEEVIAQISRVASQYGLDIDPHRPVHTLSVGEMQRVEIIRALLTNPQLLILDEPTSVLTPQAVDKLFLVLRQLADEGRSIIYISHKLHEIRTLCSACTVMRFGRVTGVCDPRQESDASLSELMVGSTLPDLSISPAQPGKAVLSVNNLCLASEDIFGTDLDGIHLSVHAGEIVGIAGVSGNGQRELLFALSGEDTRAPEGAIGLQGQNIGHLNPSQRRALGLHFVPDERLGRGAVPSLSLAHNLLLTRDDAINSAGWIDMAALKTQAESIISRYQVKAGGAQALAQSLSGGNLQKFIVGREIDASPKLLIVSQPTWGVDVGASAQIRAALVALRDAGCAVLVVSEELEELFELSDRLHVMALGRLSPSIARADATVAKIGAWMSGLWDHTEESVQ